jgi:hypothetical protein
VWRPENKTVRLHTSKKVEVGIHSSTSRLASLCMGLVIEKAVTLRETVREVDSTTNKITPCQWFGNSMKAEESLAYRSSCLRIPTRALYL